MTSAVPVLMYHSVTDDPPAATRSLSVRPSQLDAHLRFLREHGFTGLTFSELCGLSRAGIPMPARPVVLTFDDGYADTHEEALPLLVRHGFPATVFVTTGWLRDAGTGAAGAPLDRTMGWSQLDELAGAGIEVAAHTRSHPQLDQLHDIALHAELRDGRAQLEDRLGVAVPSLAYPYGYSSHRVRAATAAAGYRQAAAVANAAAVVGDGDPYAVPRLTVRRSTSREAFGRIVRCERLGRVYRTDRALTRACSAVRWSRARVRGVRRD